VSEIIKFQNIISMDHLQMVVGSSGCAITAVFSR